MRHVAVLLVMAPGLFLLTGCESIPPTAGANFDERRVDNVTLVENIHHDMISNGVISQRTIYPEHFVQDTPTLNGLGDRDLTILADHYRDDVMPVSKPVNIVDDVRVFFDYDKSDIRPDAIGVLQKAVQSLKDNPDMDILITGRADVRGSDEYNERLGNRRADAVSRYMEANGVDSNRVRIISRGEMDALAPETDEAGMQKDRNAHFVVAEVHQYPLPLNVRRDGVEDNLYQARKKSVLAFLADKGVDTNLLQISDGYAGGPGMDSNRVFLIMTDSGSSDGGGNAYTSTNKTTSVGGGK